MANYTRRLSSPSIHNMYHISGCIERKITVILIVLPCIFERLDIAHNIEWNSSQNELMYGLVCQTLLTHNMGHILINHPSSTSTCGADVIIMQT